MHFVSAKNRASKIYSLRPYALPISNDRSHQVMSQNAVTEQKHVAEKKQIQKIMHGVIKERLFGNFIKEDTRVSEESYGTLDQINRVGTGRARTHRSFRTRDFNKTYDVRQSGRREMQTIDVSRMMKTNYGRNFGGTERMRNVEGSRRFSESKKLPMLRLEEADKNMAFTNLSVEKTATKQLKLQKIPPLFHQKPLVLLEKPFTQFYRKLVGISPSQFIYDFKLSREQIYYRYRNKMDSKLFQRFFNFFGFPSSFSLRQYTALIENAANTNMRFIYFWVFVFLDDNGNGVLTHQDFFKVLQQFNQNAYIQKEVYQMVKWIEENKGKTLDTQPIFEQSLTANHNLRLQELKQLLKQTTKDRIEVDCVKNTCYHQIIISLEHNNTERLKLSQLQNTQETNKILKAQMMEKKKKLQNQPKIRLRDFYTIFNNRRPKIFCYLLNLLANINAQEYQ